MRAGRFRQNLPRALSTTRVTTSAGPQRLLHQCGLPSDGAGAVRRSDEGLVDLNHAQNIKSAKRMVEPAPPSVGCARRGFIAEHPVLLNRAPPCTGWVSRPRATLVEGKAIQLHLLVCEAFQCRL